MSSQKSIGRGVAYIRVSAVMGREELISPELQLFEISQFAKRHGIDLVHEIHDIDKSGRSFTKRHVGEAIEGIKQDKWKYVILWKWSRWGRNLNLSLTHLATVEQAGGIVRAATEDFDPSTTIGRFTRDQMLLIAELQSNQIGDGWKETHAKRRRDGLPHTTHARFGYSYSRATGYQINPDEASLLLDAYQRMTTGGWIRTLALEWNAKGIRTRRGQLWKEANIRVMMDNGFPAGLIRERTTGNRARHLKDWDTWRIGSHSPIIPMELWETYKAQRITTGGLPARLRRATYALSGLLICGYQDCGYRLNTRPSAPGKNNARWFCKYAYDTGSHEPNGISHLRANRQVLRWLDVQAEGGEDVNEAAARFAAAEEINGEVKRYEAEVSRLLAKRKRLVDLHTDEEIDENDYREKYAEVKAMLTVASDGLALAKGRESTGGLEALRRFGALRDEWSRLSPHGQNRALASVVKKILVRPGPYGPAKMAIVPAWDLPE